MTAPPDNEALGQSIERPRSALHSGDFTEPRPEYHFGESPSNAKIAVPSVAPWLQPYPHPALESQKIDSGCLQEPTRDWQPPFHKIQGGLSASLGQGIVLMPPTSPLAQQSNNTDLDFTPRTVSRSPTKSPERSTRRHTFSPQSLQSYRYPGAESHAHDTPAARHFPRARREGAFPYQAHQPRRSLTSMSALQSDSAPQTPQIRPRRPSISSESSPLQHAPMVGSYEESILRGRMSTTPSRPLNFVAQIGVLGRGLCKSNLRCPPHVTVPFPAVFYSYQSGTGRTSNDSPSPYVGLVDIENSLSPPEDSREGRRRRRHALANSDDEVELLGSRHTSPDARKLNASRRKREKIKRRSTSPKLPPGGSYRIPQQGQLQIVIKNPNKTAVKLFLVPYDLSDMEPGQKTFIRQRSYSAGPIIDMPLASRKNLGTDRPEASLSNSEDPNDRPILRYLIHVNICCPSRGRYYLYKSIRVVFANRVPDGKEKLRNEIQLPEPRYTSYKPSRETAGAHGASAALLAGEKALQRRSGGFTVSQSMFDNIDGIGGGLSTSRGSFSAFMSGSSAYETPIRPIPFSLSRLDPVESRPVSREHMDIDSDGRSTFGPSPTMSSPNSTTASLDREQPSYQKFHRGEAGYAGNFQAPPSFGSPSAIGEGLLARRLRGLDFQQDGCTGNGSKDT